jgi:N-terminal domain of anti-restriction factor ArdC
MPAERPEPHAPSSDAQGERRQKKTLLGEPELRTMVQDQMQTLALELGQGKSERLQQYLEYASRFHRYSRSNQLLIWLQRPTATQVASYRHWQDEGYQVARGETGIRILAPSLRKRTNTETGEDERVVVGFVAVSVFDVTQLTPEKRPAAFFVPLEGDQEAFSARVIAAATTDGFAVAEEEQTHGAEGYNLGRQIVTRRGLPSVNRALTLLHPSFRTLA